MGNRAHGNSEQHGNRDCQYS